MKELKIDDTADVGLIDNLFNRTIKQMLRVELRKLPICNDSSK